MTLGSDNAEPETAAPSPEAASVLAEATPPAHAPPEPEAAKAKAASDGPGRFARFREWFTRSRAISEARRSARASAVQPDLLLAAFSAIELAEACLHGRRGRLVDPALACDAGRRAVLLSLASLREPPSDASGVPDPAALFEALPADTFERAAAGQSRERIFEDVVARDFRHYAELSAEQQREIALRSIGFARSLATLLEAPQHGVDRLVRQRFLRLGSVTSLFALAVLFVSSDALISFRDLASGRSWRVSSTYGNGGCRSPAQSCTESPFFFFHTVDEDKPWVEIDLGENVEFSQLLVKNRSDCCGDRAVPLVVEVSTKRSRWKTVARIDEDFHEWRPSFSRVEARYVRLKATRKTMLHLERVRVLP